MVVIRRLSLLVLLCICPVLVHGKLQGRARIDSLVKGLLSSPEDTSRAKLLIEVSKEYRNLSPDTGIIYGNSALKLSDDLHWKLGIARSNSALGQNYESRTDNPSALDYYIRALTMFEELRDSAKINILNGLIGNVYQSLGKYSDALEFGMKALTYNRAHNDKEHVAECLGNIGVIYEQMKNYPKALASYNEAIQMNEELGKKEGVAQNLGNKAGIYCTNNDFLMAIDLANKAISIYEELDDKNSLALNYCNIGSFYVAMVKHDTDEKKMSASDKQAYIKKAIYYLDKGVAISKELGYKEGLKDGYDGLKDAYTLQDNYKMALSYFLNYSIIKDSINSTENKIKVANIESARQIEIQKKNLTILELKDANNKKTRVLYIAGIVLLLIAVGVVVKYFISELKSNRQLAKERKKHIERIRAQKTVLKDIAYIQSHEVRGPVSTILGLTQLFNYEDLADPTNGELMEGITTVANRLDKIVTEVVNKENKLNTADEIESDKEDNI